MSRYQIDQGEYRVAVGWSGRLQTYFMEVVSLKALAEYERLEQMHADMAEPMRGHDPLIEQIAAAEADCAPICWRGSTYGEITATVKLYLICLPYAELPVDVVARLIGDKLRDRSQPTAMLAAIRELTANAAQRADRP